MATETKKPDVLTALAKGDAGPLCSYVQRVVLQQLRSTDWGVHGIGEAGFKAAIVGALATMIELHGFGMCIEVEAKLGGGRGYADIVLTTGSSIVVIELKYSSPYWTRSPLRNPITYGFLQRPDGDARAAAITALSEEALLAATVSYNKVKGVEQTRSVAGQLKLACEQSLRYGDMIGYSADRPVHCIALVGVGPRIVFRGALLPAPLPPLHPTVGIAAAVSDVV